MRIVQRREDGRQSCQHPADFGCAQAGCRDCVERLLELHAGLIPLIVHSKWPGESNYADLIQEGWIGLWLAILHFDAGRGSTFSHFSGRMIRNRLWNAVKQPGRVEGLLEPQELGANAGTLATGSCNPRDEPHLTAVFLARLSPFLYLSEIRRVIPVN